MKPECRKDDGTEEFKLEVDVAEEPAEYQRTIPSSSSGEFPAVVEWSKANLKRNQQWCNG